MDINILVTQGLDSKVEWINEVIFARLGPDVFKAAVAEFFGYNVEFGSTMLSAFGVNNVFDGGFNIVRRFNMEVDLNGRKILATVDGVGVRRALSSI